MLSKRFSLLLIFSIIITFGLSISLGSLLAAWTAPASAPPEGNIAAPINTSYTGQYKKGGLILNTGEGGEAMLNGLIVQYGNVGIGTTDPQAKLDVAGNINATGNIIAATPTASDHLTTKAYVDASGGGGCFDQYYESWCASHPNEKCARVGTMDYKCIGNFCTKAGISNDMDGDGVTGATDCNDNDATIVAATDGTCDSDADGKIDQTAYIAVPKPAAADCYDSNSAKYLCLNDGTACSGGIYCASGYCIDGVCCDGACNSTCVACNVAGSIGTCINAFNDTDPHNNCTAYTCTNYQNGPTCYSYANATSHNGMCNGVGVCYTSLADSCTGQTAATTNWGEGGTGCAGSSQRCDSGACRTCSGYVYSDGCSGCAGQGGQACWHIGAATASCTTTCGAYGGCVGANWDENTNCSVCKYTYPAKTCLNNSTSGSPGTNDSYCAYRGVSSAQSCSATDGWAPTRLCVCVY